MAAEHASMSGMNGHYDPHGGHYQEVAESHLSSQVHDHANISSVPAPDSFGSQNANVSSTTGQAPNENNKHTDIPKDQVGWHFVEQYYLNLSRSPSKLHLFYNKRSQFVWGVEAEKVEVSVGRTSIADRIKELEFHDCKVRVSNVDSQASNNNILIQVIGEMSNKSAPHRKFVQTFILAEQPNGYFVLNDIFRFINDEDDVDAEIDEVQEPAAASSEETAIEPTTVEEPKVLTSSADPTEQQYDADSTVHQRGQKTLKQGHASDEQHLDEIKANGIHSTERVDSRHDAPIMPEVLRSPVTKLSLEPAAPAPTQEVSEKEKAKGVVTTRMASPTASGPAAAPPATPASVAPAKPAAPKTWAKLVATSTSAVPPTLTAAASTPSASVLSKSTPSSEKHAARPDPAHSQPHQPQGSVGWQTAGNDHAKRQTRPQSVSGAVEKETVLAYVRNVTEKVSTDALKAALTAYGELAYFDVSRQKNCAFVEFATAFGYSAAIAANPLSVGEEQVYVEERRPRSGAYGGSGYGPTRGGPMGRGGRGNGEGRLGNQGRPVFAKDGGRGGFGAGRGRGGNVTPRGRGGSPVS